MTELTQDKVELLQMASQILAQDLLTPGNLTIDTGFENFEELRRFVKAVQFEDYLNENLRLTRDALQGVSEALAEAHEAAGAISVTAPTDEQVKAFKEKLEALNQDIQGDERFHAGIKLSESLVKTLSG